MKRRDFIKIAGLMSTMPLIAKEEKVQLTFKEQFSQKLTIPPILEYKEKDGIKNFYLNVQKGKMNFFNEVATSTYGINGDFLGPTIRVQRGDNVALHVKNSLDEKTTMHWHGLKLHGKNDGGPQNTIEPSNSWTAQFSINQRASVCWYHPHVMHKTGVQVYKGLAGLFMIEDEDAHSLALPKEYGIDDIPMVLQDRRFGHDGEFLYKQSMHDVMMGVTGNIYLINGVSSPYVEVEPKLVRFRILNGSNARIYNLMFEDNSEFYQIAGDSSFLPEPVMLKNFPIAPGERAEIVVDFSKYAGKSIYFGDGLSKRAILKVVVKEGKKESVNLPEKLVHVDEYEGIEPTKRRKFSLDMAPGRFAINKKQMDMMRIDEEVKQGEYEIWEITNTARMLHPFHVHGTAFKILSRNGKKPLKNELGLKDTVLVYSMEKVEILVHFEHKAPKEFPYMYHCHILEHEDAGMMGQFIVT